MTQPQSAPFLLVRPSDVDVDMSEPAGPVYSDDEISAEYPVVPSRSVAPHAPPRRTPMPPEAGLPTIIVDLRELAQTEEQEAQRASDIDVLLAVSDEIVTSEITMPAARAYRAPRSRGVFAALILGALAVGGTFAGLHARGISVHDVGAALHIR